MFGMKMIRPADAKARMAAETGIVLLDVRSAEEYASGHIPGSVLMPLDTIGAVAATRLPDKDATIFVYCRSGMRSGEAVKALGKMGYKDVYNLGGIMSWPYEVVQG
ncbi:MAG: rhodanese-like domain-containing protein [Bacillota bacterium]